MGIFDKAEDSTKDMMSDDTKKQKIEQMAQEHGISIDEAKERFTKHESSHNE